MTGLIILTILAFVFWYWLDAIAESIEPKDSDGGFDGDASDNH